MQRTIIATAVALTVAGNANATSFGIYNDVAQLQADTYRQEQVIHKLHSTQLEHHVKLIDLDNRTKNLGDYAYENYGSYEKYFNGQKGVNAHVKDRLDKLTEFDAHLQRSENNQNKRLDRIQTQTDNNISWNDRQEGAIRANRGGIQNVRDDLTETDQRSRNNKERGIATQQAAQTANDRATALEGRADNADQQRSDLDRRVGNNEGRLDAAEQGIRDTNAQANADRAVSNARDDALSGRIDGNTSDIGGLRNRADVAEQERADNRGDIAANTAQQDADRQASVSRDNEQRDAIRTVSGRTDTLENRANQADAERSDLYATVDTVDSDSRQRDAAIVQQVRDIDQWNIEQFNQHANAINGVRDDVQQVKQDLADERAARKQQGKEANAGISSAMALGSHHFDTNYQGLQLSVSTAGYRGEHAQSLSAGGAVTESVFGSIAVSHDSRGNSAYSLQSTFKF